MKLYNLTHNGKQYISQLPPSVLPQSDYSLVEIEYTQERINKIVGTYFKDEKIMITLENVMLDYNLDQFLETISEKDRLNISQTVSFIRLPDEPEMEINVKIKNQFIMGLSSTLVYLYFLSLPDKEFLDPIKFTFPFPIGAKLLDQNIYEYINYIASLSVAINNSSIGRFWMVQILNFFDGFSSLLEKEYKIDPLLITDIAHKAIQGYSNYVYTEIYKAVGLFNAAECSATEAINVVNKEVDQIYDEVKIFKKRLFQDLEERRINMENSLSIELKESLYAEIPRITQEIDQSLDLKLYKILSKKIEECFAEVLYEYKETAAHRLRNVLEPIVYESIEKFKSVSILSQNYLKTAVDDARKYSQDCRGNVNHLERLDKEFYDFQSKTIDENKKLRAEVKYLKGELYSLNKLVERLCSVNNLKLK